MSLENTFYIRDVLGKNGIVFKQIKFRTMYPRTEHLRNQLIAEKGINKAGQINNDPRIISHKRFLKEYFIDEIPQIPINLVLKRNMSLVGIRPKTEEEWLDFSETYKQRALKYKPGFMGVNYAGIKGPQYLDEKEKHPFLTDAKYFFLIIYNLTFCGKRGV